MALIFKTFIEPNIYYDAVNTDHIVSIETSKRQSKIKENQRIYSINFVMMDKSKIIWNYYDIDLLKIDLEKFGSNGIEDIIDRVPELVDDILVKFKKFILDTAK